MASEQFELSRETRASFCITRCLADGIRYRADDEVPVEHVLDVTVEGLGAISFACTPSHLAELVVGHLLTEGLIAGVGDIEGMEMSRDGSSIAVRLAKRLRVVDGFSEVVTTCSTKTTRRSTETRPALRKLEPVPWDPRQVFGISAEFAADTPIHRATFGAHSCRIALGGELLYCCEDLGRHNAFDKAVGLAALNGVDLTKATVFTSGRAPVDMVEKAIRARIPILVSKAVPTDRTVELARSYDLTLVCSARPDSMKVFSDPLGCARSFRASQAS